MTVLAPGASARAIQHHYDVGNEFYRLWLDPSLTYSAALWEEGDDLERAQQRKLDWHLRSAQVQTGANILDVGCGWGSTIRRAINEYGIAEAVGLTLSEEQKQLIDAEELPGVEIRLESWAEHRPSKPYDGVISIGAFEHFARLDQSLEDKIAGYRQFFEFCHRVLKQDGCLSLQSISYELSDRSQFSQFFAESIFPESDLPHLEEIIQASKGLFEVVTLRNDRHHYADTLRAWLRALRNNKKEAIDVAGEANYLRYEKYLGMMIIAFHRGSCNLVRIAFKKLPK